jgi:hypothetical protein
MIAAIHSNADRQCRAFDLCKPFYELMDVLATTELQSRPLDTIILNSQIWIPSRPEVILQIQKHWLEVAFPEYSALFRRLRRFSTLLNEMVLFFMTGTIGGFKSKAVKISEVRRIVKSRDRTSARFHQNSPNWI